MITGIELKNAVISGANNIARYKQHVNELNVFPVPDGDTGTNMSMTITAAAKTLANISSATVEEVSKETASALLRGARGNSGVITSLLFRGFANGCKGKDKLDGVGFAHALTMGVESAYKAVLKPTEGTILTVSRVSAETATEAAKENNDIKYVIQKAVEGAKKALDETPEMLPILKKAGVVDAGGQGYLFILEGMAQYIATGEMITGEATVSSGGTVAESEGIVDAVALSEEDITFIYCTEYIVNRDPEIKTDPAELRAYLETFGDCVVVVADEDIIKVHVHSNAPGLAIQKGTEFGLLDKLKVDNMLLQFRQQVKENEKRAPKKVAPDKKYGFVTVAAGCGIADAFRDIGCDTVVEGGQTMNPSTEDILAAIEQTPAEVVFVLPNNKNIIMAAEQAVPLADRKVIVIRSKTIPQGIAAALAFDESMNEDELTEVMEEATRNVSTGQVTFAARDSDFDGVKIKEGQILALNEGKLAFAETDPLHAAFKLCEKLVTEDSVFITVFYGENVTEKDAMKLERALEKRFGEQVEISTLPGNQPIYHFIISVE